MNWFHLWSAPTILLINPSNAEATFVQKHKDAKILGNHPNLVMLVFIRKLTLSTLRWIPMFQGFSDFSAFSASFCIGKISHQLHMG